MVFIKNRLDVRGIHERVSVGPQLSLTRRVELCQHGGDSTDRLIVGDSGIVMDSVLAGGLMVGTVEMIYLDPPSSDSQDRDQTREASLAYLRDRLVLCRELLHESGSIFVRVGDENRSSVRSVMDEVFGADHCCGIVTLEKTSAPAGELLPSVGDYPNQHSDSAADHLVWYGRDLSRVTSRALQVLLDFQAQDPSVFGDGRERRRTCGILLRRGLGRSGAVADHQAS